MTKYQNLRFFNGASGELDFSYDSTQELWTGSIYMPKVSVGLYETANLFVFEEVVTSSGVLDYVRPISENTVDNLFLFDLQSDLDFSEDIKLYAVDVVNNEYSVLEFTTYSEEILTKTNSTNNITYQQPNHTLNVSGETHQYKEVADSIDKTPLSCNITLHSDIEGIHTRILNIFAAEDGGYNHIAKILIYGETEAEDERLSVLLSNMGASIKEEDGIIFRDSDINEISTDWKIINNKRKELLLEAHNILPFIGTYKALLNAMKFYGYDNLTIKEYWLNINEQTPGFGKLMAVAVPNQDTRGFLASKANKIELPNSNHKKTSRFSLVYRINEPTGSLDEWDLPVVKETFDFTPDEVLIKLYGLKRKLQTEYLPLQAKIVDITAEGDFFSQFTQNVWNNQNTIQVQSSGIEVDFQVFPKRRLFIEDLRLVSQDLANDNISFPLQPILNVGVIEDIKDFYNHYYDKELNTFTTLSNVPIGCPVVLEATSLSDFYNDADYTWNDTDLAANDYANNGASIYTWDNIWSRDVYEIEWIVSGPKDYLITYRGAVKDLYNMALVLPYSGIYNVTLNMYDLYNSRSFTIKNSEIKIENKAVEIYGLYEWKNHNESWSDQAYTWDLAGGFYDFSQDSPVLINDMKASWYLTLDRNNYIQDDTAGVEFSTVRRYLDVSLPTLFNETTGPYVWNRLKQQTWNDGLNNTWDSTRVGTDLAASFKININQSSGFTNGSLNIKWKNPGTQTYITETYVIQSTYPTNSNDLSSWQNVANELNALSYQTNPIFSKFNWNPVFFDNNNDGTPDVCLYLLATAKEYSSSYDYETVYFTTQSQGTVDGFVKYTAYNPTWNDVVVFDDHAKVTLMTHLTFAFEKTNMPGVVSWKWTINNTSNSYFEEVTCYNQWLTYLFSERGDYSIKLELIDSNGNKNEIVRNMLSIVKAEELYA
jgi:hypothetical protein